MGKYRVMLLCMGLGLAVSLIISLLLWQGPFESLELKTLDWRFKLRGEKTSNNEIANRITIVFVEDEYRRSLSARKFYAKLLAEYKDASAIGLDLVLESRRDEDADKLLEMSSMIAKVYYSFGKRREGAPPDYIREERVRALDRFRWEISAECKGKLERLAGDKILAPLPEFSRQATGVGHVYSTKDPDGTLRRIPLLIEYEGSFYPLLSLQIACGSLDVIEEEVCLGKHIELVTRKGRRIRIPIDENGYMFINYVGQFEKFDKEKDRERKLTIFRSYPLKRILDDPPEMSDIILVGAMMEQEEGPDCHDTPLGKYPGVVVHANVLYNILAEDFLHRTGMLTNFSASLILGLLTGGIMLKTYRKKREGESVTRQMSLFSRVGSVTGISLTGILCCAYLGTALFLFRTQSIWIDIAAPLIVLLVIIFAYSAIAICQLDIKASLLLGPIGRQRILRYCLAGVIIIASFAIVIITPDKRGIVIFAVIFLMIGLRVAGLISAKKFEEQITKLSDRIIPGSGGEKDKRAQNEDNGT